MNVVSHPATSGPRARPRRARARRAPAARQGLLHRPHYAGLSDRRRDVLLSRLLREGVADPVGEDAALEHAAREEILAAGGSLSHHHGIGKIRQDFLGEIYSEGSLAVAREVKRAIDPDNVFGAGNHGVTGPIELDACEPAPARPMNVLP